MPKAIQLKDKDGLIYPKTNRQALTVVCNDHIQNNPTMWTSNTVTGMSIKDGDTTQLTLSNNGIRIGKGITKVLVHGCIQAGDTGSQNGDMTTEIWKNNSSMGTGYNYKSSSMYWLSTSSPLLVVTVQEGDVLYLKLGGAITGNIRILNSYLTVVAI